MPLTQKYSKGSEMQDTFCYENFFSHNEMSVFDSAVERNLPGKQYHVDHGPFAGNLIAEYVNLMQDQPALSLLQHRIPSLFDQAVHIAHFCRVKLYFPWDIHTDYYLDLCAPGTVPYYNLLIPLDNVPSRTIIFDQYTNSYTDFYTYKQHHDPVENPIDEDFWNENLSMCWPHDRPYVSLKQVMPWQRRGQLQGFHRKYYHSSDNFHTRFSEPKCFLNVRLDIDAGAVTV